LPARTTARALALALAGLALAGLASGCGPTLIGTCQTKADCAPSQPYCSAQGVCIAQSGTCVPACTPPGYICSTNVCVAVKPSIEEPQPAGVSAEPRPGSP
jgi:hypothetical protein